MRITRIIIATAAIATGVSLVVVAPADARGRQPNKNPTTTTSTVLTTAVGAPFNLDVTRGKVLVADGGGPGVPITASGLTITGPDGFKVTADTLAHENANNPDGKVFYGVRNPSQCVTDELNRIQLPVAYTGHIAPTHTRWPRTARASSWLTPVRTRCCG